MKKVNKNPTSFMGGSVKNNKVLIIIGVMILLAISVTNKKEALICTNNEPATLDGFILPNLETLGDFICARGINKILCTGQQTVAYPNLMADLLKEGWKCYNECPELYATLNGEAKYPEIPDKLDYIYGDPNYGWNTYQYGVETFYNQNIGYIILWVYGDNIGSDMSSSIFVDAYWQTSQILSLEGEGWASATWVGPWDIISDFRGEMRWMGPTSDHMIIYSAYLEIGYLNSSTDYLEIKPICSVNGTYDRNYKTVDIYDNGINEEFCTDYGLIARPELVTNGYIDMFYICEAQTCNYSNWTAGSCDGNCSSSEREYTRTLFNGLSQCDDLLQCVNDSSCGICQYTDWVNGSCGGSCASGKRELTRTVISGEGCTNLTMCQDDASCIQPIPCQYSNWTIGICDGNCTSIEKSYTRTLLSGPVTCTNLNKCQADTSCGNQPIASKGKFSWWWLLILLLIIYYITRRKK